MPHDDINHDPPPDTRQNQPYISMPPKNVAYDIFKAYFHTLNRFCELFDEQDFMSRFEQDYPPNRQRSPSWWACVNAALALAFTRESRFNSSAWLYWKNASLSLDDFFTGPPRLLSAQALLAMVWSTTPNESQYSKSHFEIRLCFFSQHSTASRCIILFHWPFGPYKDLDYHKARPPQYIVDFVLLAPLLT